MNVHEMDRTRTALPPSRERVRVQTPPLVRWSDIDPLDADDGDDEVVVTSSRRLVRLAIAASDAGARFTREGLATDPAAWMLAPRAIFDGRAGVQACQDLDGFRRSTLVHGLGLDLDADPVALDELLASDDAPLGDADEDRDDPATVAGPPAASAAPRLLTCWVETVERGERLTAFLALVTARPEDLVERVVGRYGREAAASARYDEGFGPSMSAACLTIGGWLAGLLVDASGPAAGTDIVVEQRFAA